MCFQWGCKECHFWTTNNLDFFLVLAFVCELYSIACDLFFSLTGRYCWHRYLLLGHVKSTLSSVYIYWIGHHIPSVNRKFLSLFNAHAVCQCYFNIYTVWFSFSMGEGATATAMIQCQLKDEHEARCLELIRCSFIVRGHCASI